MEKTGYGHPYETPILRIILIEHTDIITSSSAFVGDDDYDVNGWT